MGFTLVLGVSSSPISKGCSSDGGGTGETTKTNHPSLRKEEGAKDNGRGDWSFTQLICERGCAIFEE